MISPLTKGDEIPACHLCGSIDLEVASGYSALKRVTSDCKPWQAGGLLALCRQCGLVQSPATRRWTEDAEHIYRDYTIYHQSGGGEQSVFMERVGSLRSDAILSALLSHRGLQETGRLLDVGCGNGAFIKSCSRALPKWRLCGSEVSNKYRSDVEAIPGVEKMFAGNLRDVEGTFDVVSMIHVIEHIPSPQTVLAEVMTKLKPGGILLVQVPDCLHHPFTLLVADHCSHFSMDGLSQLIGAAGFDVLHADNGWVPREISVLGMVSPIASAGRPARLPLDQGAAVLSGHLWLAELAREARIQASNRPFGIFGTSIAGTWLYAQLDGAVDFFVDEDPNRAGRSHFGKPILSVKDVKEGATVFIALPDPVASQVADRLRRPGVEVVTPSPRM